MSERMFRIMGGPNIPWRLVAPYEDNARANHDQSLERLHERGGLAPSELWGVVHGKRRREQPDENAAREWLRAWLASDESAALRQTITRLESECGELRARAEKAERDRDQWRAAYGQLREESR